MLVLNGIIYVKRGNELRVEVGVIEIPHFLDSFPFWDFGEVSYQYNQVLLPPADG